MKKAAYFRMLWQSTGPRIRGRASTRTMWRRCATSSRPGRRTSSTQKSARATLRSTPVAPPPTTTLRHRRVLSSPSSFCRMLFLCRRGPAARPRVCRRWACRRFLPKLRSSVVSVGARCATADAASPSVGRVRVQAPSRCRPASSVSLPRRSEEGDTVADVVLRTAGGVTFVAGAVAGASSGRGGGTLTFQRGAFVVANVTDIPRLRERTVETMGIFKHILCFGHSGRVPSADIRIKFDIVIKQAGHPPHSRGIPLAQVRIKLGTFSDHLLHDRNTGHLPGGKILIEPDRLRKHPA
mmetsp:Transcript_21577/g.43271  ORF Transcript_21577/g.43271 Transcript_21577/m.43271 type:complete len:296 (+) Transcript_21577:18-905(+)